jgi:hypothetical protein
MIVKDVIYFTVALTALFLLLSVYWNHKNWIAASKSVPILSFSFFLV